MLVASNKSLAEYNKSMQPKVSQGRELLSLEYERAKKLKEEYDALLSKIGKIVTVDVCVCEADFFLCQVTVR